MPAKKTTIIVADDDPQLLRLTTRNLEFEGYTVLSARDGQQALSLIEGESADLVLLDVMMPYLDGFSVCEQVREFSQVPIIMVTARGQDQDKVKGLDLGADDYLTKPFSVEELLARVRAVLRRSHLLTTTTSQPRPSVLKVGQLTIDPMQHLVSLEGQTLALTPTEYRILEYLAHNVGRIITQDLLLEHVWGSEYVGESHMLQVNVNRLRRKMEADPAHPSYLKTKVGIGYMLVAPSPVQS